MTIDRAARSVRVASALRASPYFRGLSDPWLRLLGKAASRRALSPGEELEPEVGPADTPCLYLLVAGEVSASTAPDTEGISELVGHEGPGSVFGSATITGEEDVPVYRAVGPVQVCVWELPELERLSARSDELRRQLETRLSLRRRRSELVDLLRRTSLFRGASHSLIRWLVASATLDRVEPGRVICRQGDEGDSMFLIVSGEVAIVQDASPDPLQQLHRGDFFGEIALIRQSTRVASAVAVSNSEVLTVGKEAFDVLYRRSASFRRAVRMTAEMRLEANVSRDPDPELIWLVNDTARPTEALAGLVVGALRDVVGHVAEPRRLQGRNGVARRAGGRAQRGNRVCPVLLRSERGAEARPPSCRDGERSRLLHRGRGCTVPPPEPVAAPGASRRRHRARCLYAGAACPPRRVRAPASLRPARDDVRRAARRRPARPRPPGPSRRPPARGGRARWRRGLGLRARRPAERPRACRDPR